MSSVSASTGITASLAETWDYYFEPRGWPGWVDQFSSIGDVGGDYPEAGGTLRWRSGTAGRGDVRERVLDHEPRRLHRIQWEDPQSSGRLTTTFEIKGNGTEVTQELDYELTKGGALAAITDRLFVRAQMRRSLERSLAALKHEVEDASRLTS